MIGLKDYKHYFPFFTVSNGMSQLEYLRQTVYAQARIRYDVINDEIKDRIEYEISVYTKFDYVNCLLVMAELVKTLKQNGAEFSTVGTQSSSLINYLLGITEDDPIKNGFLFERYISEDDHNIAPVYPFYCLHSDSENIGRIIKIIKNKYGNDSIFKMKAHSLEYDEDYVFGSNLCELDIFDKSNLLDKQCVLSGGDVASLGLFVLTVFNEKLLNILNWCKSKMNAYPTFDFDSCTDTKTWEYISSGRFINPEQKEWKNPNVNFITEPPSKDRCFVELRSLDDLSGFISIGGFSTGIPNASYIELFNDHKSLIPNEKFICQEDGMSIVNKFTGWSLSICNKVRKQICRHKFTDIMRSSFVIESINHGYSKEYAEGVLEVLIDKMRYIKSKTWSLFYAFNIYQVAYISLYYPSMFAKALAKSEKNMICIVNTN